MNCQHCGSKVEDEDEWYCPECGGPDPLDEMGNYRNWLKTGKADAPKREELDESDAVQTVENHNQPSPKNKRILAGEPVVEDEWWPYILIGIPLVIAFLSGDCASSGRYHDDEDAYEPPIGARPGPRR